MKKTGVLLLILGFLLFGLVGCTDNSSTTNNNQEGGEKAAQKTVLKFSSSLPAQGFPGVTYDYFADLVKEESNGRVEVEHYHSGTLSSDPELMDALMNGNVDMGHFMVSYVTPVAKELTPLEIPGYFPGDKYTEFYQKTKPVIDKIFSKYGVKYLGMGYPGELVWTSSEKVGDFVKTPAQMKGLTLRAPGKWDGEAIKSWGGTPAAIPIGDLSASVERGMVDLVFTGWIIIDSFKIYEMTPYVTMSGLEGAFQGIIMSEKSWNKLDAEQQAAIERATEKWMEYAYNLNAELKQEFLDKLPDAGAQAYNLTDAERAEFGKVTEQLWVETKKTAGAEGEELIEILKSLK